MKKIKKFLVYISLIPLAILSLLSCNHHEQVQINLNKGNVILLNERFYIESISVSQNQHCYITVEPNQGIGCSSINLNNIPLKPYKVRKQMESSYLTADSLYLRIFILHKKISNFRLGIFPRISKKDFGKTLTFSSSVEKI